jgi:predicted dehydrogenase
MSKNRHGDPVRQAQGYVTKTQGSLETVGIYETNRGVANRYRDRYHFDDALFGDDLPKMLDERKPQAVWVFSNTQAQGIIQASWDWIFPRKDVEIYGRKGIIRTINLTDYDIRLERNQRPVKKIAAPLPKPYGSSVEYFSAVIRGEIDPSGSQSSLGTNLIAVEIQDAARESAKTGKKDMFS